MGKRILQTGFPGQLFGPIFHGPSASHLANSTILAVLKQLEALEKRALARFILIRRIIKHIIIL
jgi:hypothetical protein